MTYEPHTERCTHFFRSQSRLIINIFSTYLCRGYLGYKYGAMNIHEHNWKNRRASYNGDYRIHSITWDSVMRPT